MVSKLEAEFALQVRALKLPAPHRELQFHPTRKWRFDFAWSEHDLDVEVEGGGWIQGRHTRGKGFSDDLKKMRLGWLVYRCDAALIRSGEAVQVVIELLGEVKERGIN